MLRAYKYQIYPTESQKILLEKHFGCARYIYNWALEQKIKVYQGTNKSVSIYALQSKLPAMKKESDTSFLSEVSAQSLQAALHNLDQAYTSFFKKKSQFPRFKSKHKSRNSFSNPQGTSVDWDKSKVYILKFKEGIKFSRNRQFDGKIKTSTVSRTPTNKYYISILVETPEKEPRAAKIDKKKSLGLDFGIYNLVTTSDGEKFVNPRALNKYSRLLRIRQKSLSRKTPGSKNKGKSRFRVALLHERISNIRNDNLHKITAKLVRENQATTFCLEDLSVAGMLNDNNNLKRRVLPRSKSLHRSISDASWRELRRQLEYKAKWRGKNVLVIGRFELSSQICSHCGSLNRALKLSDRNWECPCGAKHDRDINAAINIKNIAFKKQNTYGEKISLPAMVKARYREDSRESTKKLGELVTGPTMNQEVLFQ